MKHSITSNNTYSALVQSQTRILRRVMFLLLWFVVQPVFGQEVIRITFDESNEYDPCWSPSGDSIAFTSNRTGKQHIYFRSLLEQTVGALTSGESENIHPEWSPTGLFIAFSSDRSGNQEMWFQELNNNGAVNFTNHPASEESLVFSPDNLHVFFNSNRNNGNWDIWSQPLEGGGATRLTTHPGNDGEPAVSPDGTKVAFISSRAGNMDIWVMNSNGSNPTQLTSSAALDIMPCWSPCGQFITFASNRNGNFNIFTVSANGGNPIQETFTVFNEVYPAWSPSGQYLAFSADYEGNEDVYIMKRTLRIPYLNTINTDGTLSSNEWSGALALEITGGGRKASCKIAHNGQSLLFAFDLKNTTNDVALRFPEILLDINNNKSATWMNDDWWFHVSATDCYYQGTHSNYSQCETEHTLWTAMPNFSTNPTDPLVDTLEIEIPLATIGLSTNDTAGMALDITNTANAWEYWPLGASISAPSTWGTFTFEHPVTGFNHNRAIEEIVVYPNPTKGSATVFLSYSNEAIKNLQLYDLMGTRICDFHHTVQNHSNTVINLQALSSGIYLLHLTTQQNQVFAKKIVVN